MRVYFEKPRTTVGWKGLDQRSRSRRFVPHQQGPAARASTARRHRRARLAGGTEFLDTTFGQFYADLVSWGAIGARTAESQIHRELASGLSMPVGIKNRTDGNVQVAVDAIARRGEQPPVSVADQRRCAGDSRDHRQPVLPRGAARRQRDGAELSTRPRRKTPAVAARRAASANG